MIIVQHPEKRFKTTTVTTFLQRTDLQKTHLR